MDNLALILVEFVSAVICFVLLRFMMEPYRATGEGRYLGLPVGFALLGSSYVFIGLNLYFESCFSEQLRWVQLFAQAYAFAFLAATYYFSKKPSQHSRLWWALTYAGLAFAAVISYLVVFEPPIMGLPSYKTVDEYFRMFNIICLVYISVYALRSHASQSNSGTIWFPLGYLLLCFSQYSFLLWSVDSSYSAYLGGHFLRVVSLLIFLFVAYHVFYVSWEASEREGRLDEETPA